MTFAIRSKTKWFVCVYTNVSSEMTVLYFSKGINITCTRLIFTESFTTGNTSPEMHNEIHSSQINAWGEAPNNYLPNQLLKWLAWTPDHQVHTRSYSQKGTFTNITGVGWTTIILYPLCGEVASFHRIPQ